MHIYLAAILMVGFGIFCLFKKKLRISNSRTISSRQAQIIGLTFIAAGSLTIINMFIGYYSTIGGFMLLSFTPAVVAFIITIAIILSSKSKIETTGTIYDYTLSTKFLSALSNLAALFVILGFLGLIMSLTLYLSAPDFLSLTASVGFGAIAIFGIWLTIWTKRTK